MEKEKGIYLAPGTIRGLAVADLNRVGDLSANRLQFSGLSWTLPRS
jgi:hypothetical protein